jgi:hypothetical protein
MKLAAQEPGMELTVETGPVSYFSGIFSDPFAFTVVNAATGQPVPGVTIEAPDGYEFPVNVVPEPSSFLLCLLGSIGIGCPLIRRHHHIRQ